MTRAVDEKTPSNTTEDQRAEIKSPAGPPDTTKALPLRKTIAVAKPARAPQPSRQPPRPVIGPPLTPSLRRAMQQCCGLLIPRERILAWSPQIRWCSLFHRRVILVATTNRLLEFRRGLFGGYGLIGVRWQDLERVSIHSSWLASRLVVRAFDMPDFMSADLGEQTRLFEFTFRGFHRFSCAAVYRIAQANEQSWREKRRTRQMEELRAKSGGFVLGQAPNTAGVGTGSQGAHRPLAERLAEARHMFEQGQIEDSEYQALKAKILNDL